MQVGQSSPDDVTVFSHGCCKIGCLVETGLLGLEVSCWRFLEAEFPLDARVTLSSPGLPGIIRLCSRPFCPKPEIQHDRRGRGMLTLTGEEATIRERKNGVVE